MLAERREAVVAAAKRAGNKEWSGDYRTLVRNRRDPFEDLDAVRSGTVRQSDKQARAYASIERSAGSQEFGFQLTHDQAEAATQLLQTDYNGPGAYKNDISGHILRTGSPEYQENFRKYVQDPEGEASRAALSLTLANGGYLLPYVLDPTIVLTNVSSANPYRRISELKTTTSNAWQGVSSAGVTAAWLAEGTAAADATPTVGQIQVVPLKAAAWLFGSYEVLADTDFAQQLPGLLADARDRLEENAFAVGNGSTQPQGITIGATTAYTTATTLVFAIADVYGCQATLPPRWRTSPKAAWVMNVVYINKARQFDTAGGASYWTNLGKGQPETLLGAPIYESTSLFSGTQAIGSILGVFGDFAQFYIVDRVGVSLIYEPLVKDQATARPTGQAGWFMFWRTASKVSTTNAFLALTGK